MVSLKGCHRTNGIIPVVSYQQYHTSGMMDWSEREDLNLRPLPPEGSALPG